MLDPDTRAEAVWELAPDSDDFRAQTIWAQSAAGAVCSAFDAWLDSSDAPVVGTIQSVFDGIDFWEWDAGREPAGSELQTAEMAHQDQDLALLEMGPLTPEMVRELHGRYPVGGCSSVGLS